MALNFVPKSLQQWWEPAAKEAAEQQVGKRSKLDTAYQAIMTRHMGEIARQEEEAVSEYRSGKTGVDVGKKSTGGNNDLIVCDNMTIDNGKGSGVLPALLGAAATIAGLYYGGILDFPKSEQPPAAVDTDTDTNTRYEIEALPGE